MLTYDPLFVDLDLHRLSSVGPSVCIYVFPLWTLFIAKHHKINHISLYLSHPANTTHKRKGRPRIAPSSAFGSKWMIVRAGDYSALDKYMCILYQYYCWGLSLHFDWPGQHITNIPAISDKWYKTHVPPICDLRISTDDAHCVTARTLHGGDMETCLRALSCIVNVNYGRFF